MSIGSYLVFMKLGQPSFLSYLYVGHSFDEMHQNIIVDWVMKTNSNSRFIAVHSDERMSSLALFASGKLVPIIS